VLIKYKTPIPSKKIAKTLGPPTTWSHNYCASMFVGSSHFGKFLSFWSQNILVQTIKKFYAYFSNVDYKINIVSANCFFSTMNLESTQLLLLFLLLSMQTCLCNYKVFHDHIGLACQGECIPYKDYHYCYNANNDYGFCSPEPGYT
jgi:hypothetical protein